MGEVYLAEDTQLGRQVAIKFLNAQTEDPDGRRRLLNEARAAAALDHPHICSVYEVSTQSDPPFIVMQYIDGETLAARLRRGPLPYVEAVRICIEVAEALTVAHRQGIVHRDVKPQNIMLTTGGHARLLDFGLARRRPANIPVAAEATHTVTYAGIVGTPAYMAPEQIQVGEVDGRTDLFALGAVLYECLTGRPPFSGRSDIEVFASILYAEPPPPSTLVPALTPAEDRLCARLLRKHPDDRFESASDVVTALRELESGTRGFRRVPEPVLRFTRPAFIAVTALLALAVAVTLWLVRERPLSLSPAPDAAPWYDRGVASLQEGSYLAASRALQRAVELDPDYPFGWARLAEAQMELDEEDRAAESVLKAVRLVDDRSRLPEVERLAFEATMGMVTREYAGAQSAYAALLGRRPGSAPVRLDLGRAYEAGEATDKAIEQYREAGRLDPGSPAAFLRLGVLYGRQDNTEQALEALSRAEDLYSAGSNLEGIASVALQRGIVLSRLGDRAPPAQAELERAQKLAESVKSTYLEAAALFRLSSLSGTRGRHEEAEQLALKALDVGRDHDSLTAFGLVDLGNVFIYAGQYERALQYFDQALRLAGSARARRAEARARLASASLQMSLGRVDDATRNARAALAYYERAGFRGLKMMALTLLAQGLARTGDLEGAFKSHTELLDLARARNVPSQVAEQHNQLAGLLLMRERYEPALEHCEEALSRFRNMESPYDIGYAGLLRAEILSRLGRFEEAGRQLSSLGIEGPTPDAQESTGELRRFHLLGRANLALLRGDAAQARALAQEGLGTALEGRADDVEIELRLVLALAQARTGRMEAAWRTLDETRERAKIVASAVLASRLSLARAEVALLRGRTAEALALAVPLASRFQQEGRLESAWLSYSVAARAAALRGESDEERSWQQHARQAQTAFEETLSPQARVTWRLRKDLPLVIH